MKAICLVLMISAVGFVHGTSYAIPSPESGQTSSESTGTKPADRQSDAKDGTPDRKQTDRKPSDERPRRGSGKTQVRNRVPLTTANRSKIFPNREGSRNGSATSLHQARPSRSDGIAGRGSLQNEALDSSALPTRPPGAVVNRGPSRNPVSHRGPNPAVIDGSAHASIRSTAAIDGTRMTRKR